MLADEVLVDLVESRKVQTRHVVQQVPDVLEVLSWPAVLFKRGAALEVGEDAVLHLRDEFVRPRLNALADSEFKSLEEFPVLRESLLVVEVLDGLEDAGETIQAVESRPQVFLDGGQQLYFVVRKHCELLDRLLKDCTVLILGNAQSLDQLQACFA